MSEASKKIQHPPPPQAAFPRPRRRRGPGESFLVLFSKKNIFLLFFSRHVARGSGGGVEMARGCV